MLTDFGPLAASRAAVIRFGLLGSGGLVSFGLLLVVGAPSLRERLCE